MADASAMCSLTAAGIFARASPRSTRAMTIVAPATTAAADHTIPPYSAIQKCPTIPATPVTASAHAT